MATIGTRINTWLRGKFIGRDEFGNSYYQERREPKGRRAKRWVVYKGLPEPSKVPPHWHGWLHYTHDTVPVEGQKIKDHEWQKDHLPNPTGTAQRYLPEGHLMNKGERAAASADYVAWKPE
ncbi:MAG: NADH:ubiquinone oxidoreductase subunit NDUFA12 [Rickettsiales bacterium]|nr:NADH:ubiquinone oxidoreductase subunit NDUFA12 [Rickettsiales bacterium]